MSASSYFSSILDTAYRRKYLISLNENSVDNMRIKFNFCDIPSYSESFLPKSWFLFDPDGVQTVADLAEELTHKFRLKCHSDSLQLSLNDYVLPKWESTRILRDDETVRFVYLFINHPSSSNKAPNSILSNVAPWIRKHVPRT